MSESPDSNNAALGSLASEPVGRVEGVRPCVQCGHDLHGQPILREAEHGLLVARCSECGRFASLMDYPMLGLWGRRLGIMLMLLMLAMVIPIALLSALAIFGVGVGLYEEKISAARGLLETMLAASGLQQVTPEWWEANESRARSAMYRAFATMDRQSWTLTLAFAPVPFLIGIIWSAILCGVRRRWIWVTAPIIGLLAFTYVWLSTIGRSGLGTIPVWPYSAAFQIMALPALLAIISVQVVLMAGGLLMGRSILRSIARFVLPPSSRRLLAFLWTIDGLPPPRRRG